MDISALKPTERRIDIVHPGKPDFKLGIWVTLKSLDADEVKKIRRAITDQSNRLALKGKYLKADEIDQNLINMIVAAVTGWGWEKDDDGEQSSFKNEQPVFNERNVRHVLTELTWFRDQLAEAIGDTNSFFAN